MVEYNKFDASISFILFIFLIYFILSKWILDRH